MSGIAGIVHFDGRGIERSDLERMNESLAHRGPDGVGIWYEDFVGFGHRMLWTTPESLKEKLTFVCPARELIITADARIDNRDELAHLLALSLSVEISDSNL
ncbi:MAG: asparagine synthetase B, partial [Methylococcaceae bacterium]|nr:asparagine synthetase B [Methylococcaceae bacterium]